MNEEDALKKSTGYVNCKNPRGGGWLLGYLSFEAANYLISTKKYKWFRVDWCGYIVERVKE